MEPRKRSEEIQSVLKLDAIGHTRTAFNSARNKLQTAQKTATAQIDSARSALLRHLQIPTLSAVALLDAVNNRRALLSLPAIADLTPDARLDAGLVADTPTSAFNKVSALRDLTALSDAAPELTATAQPNITEILNRLAALDVEPTLLAAVQRRSLIEKGVELLDGHLCPLCDRPWSDEQHLRDHLLTKLAKSEEARKLQDSLLEHGAALADQATRLGLSPQ